MRRTARNGLVILLALGGVLAAFQRIPRRFMDDDEAIALPPDAAEKTELAFARLRYPAVRASGMWAMRGSWLVDYPKADRQFVQGVRRLTRLHVRSTEEVVDLLADNDRIFDYPFVYVVEPGHWDLPEAQARKLREFTDRGGFLMTDDFHGTYEWGLFMNGLRKAYPDREVIDLDSADPIFHVLYDLNDKVQIPGIQMFWSGRPYEYDGVDPKWRAVRDDKGRVVMAICHNMDIGDAWEWADAPEYPEKFAGLAYRVGINYVIYSMTH